MPIKLLRVITAPFTIATGIAVKVHSTVGSTLVTRIVTKRELISSSDPFTLNDVPDSVLLLSLLSSRLMVHPLIAGVLHATSHVNSNVVLLTLVQLALYIESGAELKIYGSNTCNYTLWYN